MTGLQRKERPIIFSGSSVRAILEGRKTVTRRVVKTDLACNLDEPRGQADVDAGYPFVDTENGYVSLVQLCPYGQPGDRLWVRETFAYADKTGTYDAAPDDQWRPIRPGMEPEVYRCWYRASDGHTADGFWKPSIHMPRWASRILLEITAVRVERLHAITNEQCIAEGCRGGHGSIPGYIYNATPQEHFRHIWESVGGDYFSNPWVWVIEFRRNQP